MVCIFVIVAVKGNSVLIIDKVCAHHSLFLTYFRLLPKCDSNWRHLQSFELQAKSQPLNQSKDTNLNSGYTFPTVVINL